MLIRVGRNFTSAMTGKTYFTLTKKLKSYKREERLLMVCSEHCVLLFHVRFPVCVVNSSLTLQDETDRLSRNVGNYQYTLRNIPEERRSHILLYLHMYYLLYNTHNKVYPFCVYIYIYKHVIYGRFQEQFRICTILEPT